jgi:hypothetical protein
MRSHDDALERARALWQWKDLSRGVDVDAVIDAVTSAELDALTTHPPARAVDTLGRRLVDRGALANRTVVTPTFLLHLADSDPGRYSPTFPIFDVRCWVAFVYLARRRTGSEPLPKSATTSASRFGEFSAFFQRTLPESTPAREYERALFRFGAYISSLPGGTVSDVDKHLAALEAAAAESCRDRGFAIVPVADRTRD